MTAPRTSDESTATTTIPPATPIARAAGTPLLKKIHAIRPMRADRESRRNIATFPPVPAI